MFRKFKNLAHLIEAFIANIIYGFPSRRLYVIGITGTDGKTTTANLIYHILKDNGKKVAVISTLGALISNKNYGIGAHFTNPPSFTLQKYIKKAVSEGCKYLVLEVTSHGLDQNRSFGVNFKIGILTNITHEHLDYHRTYNAYAKAKLKLFKGAKIAILNKDDKSFNFIRNKLIGKKIITYAINNNADFTPNKFPFESKLTGEFNIYNCLASIAACKTLKINDDKIRQSILSFKSPTGRQEIVYDSDFKVMVDFAHTPNSFEKILSEVSKVNKNRIIHVFGAAGKRDYTKRIEMGKISSKYSDVIILTAEDPRNESIDEIMLDIQKGIKKEYKLINSKDFDDSNHKKILFKIKDRKEAINFAISIAKKGDFVLLTGKGHEKSMNYGKGEEPWDEFEAANLAIKAKTAAS